MNIREEVIEAFAAQLALVTKATAVFEGRTPDIGLIRLAALHCRILAHAHAILALVQNGCIPAIPTQLRSQLDGYIDFQLLYENADYWDRLQLDYLRSRRDAHQALLVPRRAAHLPAHDMDTEVVRERIRKMDGEIDRLAGRGVKKLMAVERYRRAGKLHLYESLYLPLCDHVHNNLRVLIEHHVERKGSQIHLLISGAESISGAATWLSTAALMPTETVHLLFERQGNPDHELLDGLMASHEVLHEAAMEAE